MSKSFIPKVNSPLPPGYQPVISDVFSWPISLGNNSVLDGDPKTTTENYWWYKANGFHPPDHKYNRTNVYEFTPFSSAINTYNGDNGPINWYSYRMPASPGTVEPPWDSLEAKAIKSFYSKIRYSDFNAAVTLAEMNQTISLIAQTAYRVSEAVTAVQRLDLKRLARALGMDAKSKRRAGKYIDRNKRKIVDARSLKDFTANTWLEVKYGWKPLLSDIESSMEALFKLMEADDADFHVRGKRRWSERNDEVHGSGEVTRERKATYLITGRFQVVSSEQRKWSGLGLTSLSSVIWEKIPFSFVADWFVPVGSYLESLSVMEGLRYVGGTVTKCSWERIQGRVPGGTRISGYWYTHGDTLYLSERYRMDRDVMINVPDPTKILFSKSFADAMSVDHAVTALALMNSKFR